MALPMSLAYGLSKISSYSTNYFRIEVANQTTAENNSVITVNLPINALVNFKSIAMHVTASCPELDIPAAGVIAAHKVFPLLPEIDQLISRIELYAGGIQIQSGFQGYSTVSTAKNYVHHVLDYENSYPRVLNNSGLCFNTVGANSDNTKKQTFILQNWCSFLGECEPSYIDTSLFPSIQMRIYLHGSDVLGGKTNRVGATSPADLDATDAQKLLNEGRFKFEDIYFTCETIAFSDNLYDDAVSSRLRGEGFIDIPFKNYFTFTEQHNSGNNSTTRFALSAQSIDNLYMINRPQDYRTDRVGKGYITVPNTKGSSFILPYFRFMCGLTGSLQYNINNMYESDANL